MNCLTTIMSSFTAPTTTRCSPLARRHDQTVPNANGADAGVTSARSLSSLFLLLLMRPSFSCPGADRFLRSSNAGAFVRLCHRAIFDTRLAVHVHRARTVEEREYGAEAQALKRARASNHHEVNHAAEGSTANIKVAGVIVYRVSRCNCSKLNNALNMSARLQCMALAQSARSRVTVK
jgi:hypothetical protein